MTPEEIADQLKRLGVTDDLPARSAELVDRWKSLKVGAEALEPVLRFMEEHPSADLGTPGALVHFVERFYGHGYEEKLLESISRRPTQHTAWMLNRVINGTTSPSVKQRYVAAMTRAKAHPQTDSTTLNQIDHFLQRLGAGGT
jgi:hypothetical protein